MDGSPWDSPGQNTGAGSHSLLQGIFPTQGSNSGLPHCRQILYHLSHQGSPGVGSHSLLQEIFSLTLYIYNFGVALILGRGFRYFLGKCSESSSIHHSNLDLPYGKKKKIVSLVINNFFLSKLFILE